MAVSDQAVATGKQLDQLCINTIRTLSMDAVQKANSGHPGAPMARPRQLMFFGNSSCATTRRIRIGPIATALSSPTGTRPCFCIHCFI